MNKHKVKYRETGTRARDRPPKRRRRLRQTFAGNWSDCKQQPMHSRRDKDHSRRYFPLNAHADRFSSVDVVRFSWSLLFFFCCECVCVCVRVWVCVFVFRWNWRRNSWRVNDGSFWRMVLIGREDVSPVELPWVLADLMERHRSAWFANVYFTNKFQFTGILFIYFFMKKCVN